MDAEVFEFTAGTTPLLISFPHSGTILPAPLRSRMTEDAHALPDTDWHVPQLYAFARELGAATLTATHSRYVVDLNRPGDGAPLYPGLRETTVCPTETFDGRKIYACGEEPDSAEIAQRLRMFWQPYHDHLNHAIRTIQARHGRCMLWDAHSIRSRVPALFPGRLPDLNVGTAYGRSCSLEPVRRLTQELALQTRFSFVLNGRFKGGYITRHYGAPERSIDAIQMEIAQSAYMSEDAIQPFDSVLARDLQTSLRRLIQSVL